MSALNPSPVSSSTEEEVTRIQKAINQDIIAQEAIDQDRKVQEDITEDIKNGIQKEQEEKTEEFIHSLQSSPLMNPTPPDPIQIDQFNKQHRKQTKRLRSVNTKA
ncbi:hypothetical protein [Candidatus Protochlamydia phocaeensis]|uniref:hypothetical protein n=1 Tax=Candidatus Protochlamydia phocaeensis TaxID=1414722 RepID=UPI000839ADA7|nr:hypothetical protein [Candidatus Protochlamydia phocaeensis]